MIQIFVFFPKREDVLTKHIEPPSGTQKQSSGSKQAKVQVKEQSKELRTEKLETQKQVQPPAKLIEKSVSSKANEKPNSKFQDKTLSSKSVEEIVTKTAMKQVQSASVEQVSPSTKNNRKKRSELSTLHQMSKLF